MDPQAIQKTQPVAGRTLSILASSSSQSPFSKCKIVISVFLFKLQLIDNKECALEISSLL